MRIQIKIVALAILTIAFALGAAVMPAMAAGDTSGGSFEMENSQPTITSVDLYAYTHDGSPLSAMDPTVEYGVKIVAGDANTLDDLRLITVVINESGYTAGSDNVQKQATYTWTCANGIGTGAGTWALVGPGSTTWALMTANCTEPAMVEASAATGTWYLNFKPAKTAEEASWGINVTVRDQQVDSDKGTEYPLTMNFYSEITTFTDSFDFSTVALGSTTKEELSSNVIANGGYLLQSKTEVQWGGNTYYVDIVGSSPEAYEVQLVNNATDTSEASSAVSAHATTYGSIYGYTSGLDITVEAGVSKPVFLWLTLPSTGIHKDTYTGTYYYQILND